MIVLDTSALVEFLVGSDQVAEEVRAAVAEDLAAPYAVDLECASTLRGLVHGKKLLADEARRALDGKFAGVPGVTCTIRNLRDE